MTNFDHIYMQMAREIATASKAKRKKVGSILVTSNGVLLPGYNGTPAGWSNACEDSFGITMPTVIHSELNTVLKAAKEGISVIGSTIYVTLSPCLSCSAMLAQAGVKRIVYDEEYRDMSGVNLLLQKDILVERLCE
jgi:dCMP deaminase